VSGLRLSKPWTDLDADAAAALPGQLGVYEVADGQGQVMRIGVADARQPFGLRSALGHELARWGPGHRMRVEVTHAYRSRYLELLMLYLHDHGRLPPGNDDDPTRIGRLSPA
jgi:hypothetical protein